MREDVGMHVRRCVPCAAVNDPCKLPKAPLINIETGHPLKRVAIDIVRPTPRSISRHEWLRSLLFMDDYFMNTTEYVRNTYTCGVFSVIFSVCSCDWFLNCVNSSDEYSCV